MIKHRYKYRVAYGSWGSFSLGNGKIAKKCWISCSLVLVTKNGKKKTCVPEAKGNEKGYICTNDIYHSCSQLKRQFFCGAASHSSRWRRPPGTHIALVSIRSYLPWSLGDQIFKSQATTANKTNIKKEVNGNPAFYIEKKKSLDFNLD